MVQKTTKPPKRNERSTPDDEGASKNRNLTKSVNFFFSKQQKTKFESLSAGKKNTVRAI